MKKTFSFWMILSFLVITAFGVSYFVGLGAVDYLPTVGGGMKEDTFSLYVGLSYYWLGGIGVGAQAGYRMMDLFEISLAEGRGLWNVDLGLGVDGTLLTFFYPGDMPFYASIGAGVGVFQDFKIDQLKLHSMSMVGIGFSTSPLFGWGFGGIGPTFSSYVGFEF